MAPSRTTRAWGALLAFFALGLGACDDRESIPLEEQRLFFTADRTDVCPSIEDGAENIVFLTATVFGIDGQVQQDAPVTITSPNAPGGPFPVIGTTNERGQFTLEYPIAIPSSQRIYDFSAAIENGETGDVKFFVPATPVAQVTAASGSVEVDEEIELFFLLSGPCQINGLDYLLDFSEDDSGNKIDRLDFVPGSQAEGLLLNADFDGTAGNEKTEFVFTPDEVNERLRIQYRRLASDPNFGTSLSGSYFSIKMKAKNSPGPVIIVLEDAIHTPSQKLSPAVVDLENPIEGGDPRLIGIRINVVEATP